MKKIYNWLRCLPSWHVVKLDGNANNAENAEAFYINANNTASNNNVNIASQLALKSESEHQNHASWQNTQQNLIGAGRSSTRLNRSEITKAKGTRCMKRYGNLYLSGFDHYMKEQMHCKYYFRYCDDVVILHNSKEHLANLRIKASEYLEKNLKLQLKSNWQVFPVATRGIDFLGYRFYHTHTTLRKSIATKLKQTIAKTKSSTIKNNRHGKQHNDLSRLDEIRELSQLSNQLNR